jgi:hypothetical protein
MIRNIGSLISELPAGERLLLISHNGHCGREMSASGVPAQAATWPAFGTHYATELAANTTCSGRSTAAARSS